MRLALPLQGREHTERPRADNVCRAEIENTRLNLATFGHRVQILTVHLQASTARSDLLRRFYADELGLPALDEAQLTYQIGATTLTFTSVDDAEPYYHFAIRVPRNRFGAAYAWLADHTELLAELGSHETLFDFDNWNAFACYAHDPCGNIVELIAHRNIPDEQQLDHDKQPFSAAELRAVCEIGLVGPDTRTMANHLEAIGVPLWDGEADDTDSLAFMGSRDGVLILSPIGRGWLPTRRPAEMHPVEVTLAGRRPAQLTLPATPHQVRITASSQSDQGYEGFRGEA